MNIGKRPTFYKTDNIFLEVNIFDFIDDIYDNEIRVNFIKFIREERKFDSIEDLIKQMNSDKKECLGYIKNNLS
jgi:riboflavin kinase / FMN adenylyltransferase